MFQTDAGNYSEENLKYLYELGIIDREGHILDTKVMFGKDRVNKWSIYRIIVEYYKDLLGDCPVLASIDDATTLMRVGKVAIPYNFQGQDLIYPFTAKCLANFAYLSNLFIDLMAQNKTPGKKAKKEYTYD